MDVRGRFLDFFTRHRTLILTAVGLPAGFLLDGVRRAGAMLRERFASPERHDARVAEVQEQVRRWNQTPISQRKPLCTDRRTWQNLSTRFEPKHNWHRVRMGHLCEILAVDEERGTVRVEPFVTVGQITRYLVPRGYMLAVNLEIADATVGGLALAAGMTTHSHKVGMLHETVVAWDVVLADGSLVRATEAEHADLFRALPWSHGTLGLLVALELKIIRVKPYVKLRYEPVSPQRAYCERMRELSTSEDAPDFVEATVFSRDRAVIMTADFADPPSTPEERAKVNPIGRWHKPWFYTHIARFLDGAGEELVPLQHYLLRHNRSIFWAVRHMIPPGNRPAFRWLLGWLMPPRIALLKLSTTPAVRKMTFTLQVFQDIVLPMSAMPRAIDMADRLFGMYPILLYPSRVYDHGDMAGQLGRPRAADLVANPGDGGAHAMYFDLGVYGVPRPIEEGRKFRTVHAMRRMEEFTREVGGYPFLYADTFMTREEFEKTFDLSLYEQVRRRYGANDAFPHLYDKIRPEVDVLAVLDEEAAFPDLDDPADEAAAAIPVSAITAPAINTAAVN